MLLECLLEKMPPPQNNRPPPVERKSAQEALAESAARPLDFDAEARTVFLKNALIQVREMQQAGRSVDEIRAAIPLFSEKYPELFKKVTTPGEDLTPLLGMMGLLEKIGAGEMSHHNASVMVGQALAAKFMPQYVSQMQEQADGQGSDAGAPSSKRGRN
jgi:hypothetical protein